LLADLWQKAKVHGLYYVKPSLALGWCEPSFSDSQFLDTGSIDIYQVADGGRAYTLYLAGAAIERTTLAFVGPEESARKSDAIVRSLAWQDVVAGIDVNGDSVTISPLLLDSDVIYSDSAEMAIEVILSEQRAAKGVLVFGGPPSLGEPLYARYVKESIDLIREGDIKFAVMSYLPASDPVTSLTWLEVCYRLAREGPATFRFGAFPIGGGQLRPFSYQVFDKVRVHVGLRVYDPVKATPTLSSAILLRNSRIAQLFTGEFAQSFQAIGQVDLDRHHALVQSFAQLDVASRQKMEQAVRQLLA
jgi:hypothetical protein